MRKTIKMIITYVIILVTVISLTLTGNKVITTISEQVPLDSRKCIVIDPGHGGIDGGATSYTGVLESQLNLEIALRLNDFMHFLGVATIMTRSDDRSIYTQGDTIAAQKVSDLQERVRIVNTTDNAILISIHQNTFHDHHYYGAQVFYSTAGESKALATQMQAGLISALNPGSNRNIKKAHSIYLLENINTTGILIECGFISNPEEEAKLRNAEYQKKLSAVIASVCSLYLHSHDT